jgi:homocysteine S-methyltransferase
MNTRLPDMLAREPVILTEGAVIERLRRTPSVALDPHVLHAGFTLRAASRAALMDIYRGYLDVGRRHDLPLILFTPTWRATPERARAAGLDCRELNAAGTRLLVDLRHDAGAYGARVLIGGLMGCRGNAYDPGDALPTEEAAAFHAEQARSLAEAGVDFLMVATLPAFSEAIGLAHALTKTGVPYLLSFVLRSAGTLLDDTPLEHAIERIDASVTPAPLAYLVNCVHPDNFARGLGNVAGRAGDEPVRRIIGLQANTSARQPEELDGADALDGAAPEAFAEELAGVQQRFRLKVIGGCCGTDENHIDALAVALTRRRE